MHVKFGDKTRQTKEKALRIIDFKPQTSPSDCIFKKNKILKISDFVKYKYSLFVIKSLRQENVVIFNNMFTPLNLKTTITTLVLLSTIFLIYLRSKHVFMRITP